VFELAVFRVGSRLVLLVGLFSCGF
jgi:hypothetical protein